MKRLMLVLAVAALCAAAPTDALAQAQSARVLNSWTESVKLPDGTEATHRVDLTYDYASGVTLRRTYDEAGTLLDTERVDAQPRPTSDETAEAAAIIAADPELGSLLVTSGATIEGGFLYSGEDFEAPLAACASGARCLQFDLITPSRIESVRFVVVDLVTRQVVERDLFPDL